MARKDKKCVWAPDSDELDAARDLVKAWEKGTFDYHSLVDSEDHQSTLQLIIAYTRVHPDAAPPSVYQIERVAGEIVNPENNHHQPHQVFDWWYYKGLNDPKLERASVVEASGAVADVHKTSAPADCLPPITVWVAGRTMNEQQISTTNTRMDKSIPKELFGRGSESAKRGAEDSVDETMRAPQFLDDSELEEYDSPPAATKEKPVARSDRSFVPKTPQKYLWRRKILDDEAFLPRSPQRVVRSTNQFSPTEVKLDNRQKVLEVLANRSAQKVLPQVGAKVQTPTKVKDLKTNEELWLVPMRVTPIKTTPKVTSNGLQIESSPEVPLPSSAPAKRAYPLSSPETDKSDPVLESPTKPPRKRANTQGSIGYQGTAFRAPARQVSGSHVTSASLNTTKQSTTTSSKPVGAVSLALNNGPEAQISDNSGLRENSSKILDENPVQIMGKKGFDSEADVVEDKVEKNI